MARVISRTFIISKLAENHRMLLGHQLEERPSTVVRHSRFPTRTLLLYIFQN